MQSLLTDPTHVAVVNANVTLHSAAAATYDDEPHFRPESQERVRRILKQIVPGDAKTLLDLGCGTGFLTMLADGLVSSITAVDATVAMIEIARSRPYRSAVEFHVADVLEVDLPENSFDVVAGYAFLHHLLAPAKVIERAARWVQPGGTLYFDLEPNKRFWDSLATVAGRPNQDDLAPAVRRELRSVSGVNEAEHYGIDSATFALAEYNKKITGGIDLNDLERTCAECGLVDFKPLYHWFVGEAGLIGKMVTPLTEERTLINDALQAALPLSSPMFKYVGFTARRP